jgi:hypothetical protein
MNMKYGYFKIKRKYTHTNVGLDPKRNKIQSQMTEPALWQFNQNILHFSS